MGAKLLAERLVSITSGELAGGMSSPRACLSWMRGKHASHIGVLEEKAQEASADVSLTDGSSDSSASASAKAVSTSTGGQYKVAPEHEQKQEEQKQQPPATQAGVTQLDLLRSMPQARTQTTEL